MTPRVVRRRVEAVVIGGGQAGVSLSYFLTRLRVSHVVLERDRPFASWHNRWEGFSTNTPNWMNTLPMGPPGEVPSGRPGDFATKDELIEYLNRCLTLVAPPIETGDVRRVVEVGSGEWEVHTDSVIYEAASVAVCTGAMSRPRLPAAAPSVDARIDQIHSSEYRSPAQIHTRNVLIVGSASSGVQICRLLAESGRFDKVGLAVSKVTTLPSHVLGIQTHRFLHAFGLFDVRSRSLLGRMMYSGLETKGDPIMRPAPRDLARDLGVELFGRFAGHDGERLVFDGNGTMSIDDLTIVWCTGFRGDYEFIEVMEPTAVFDEVGAPIHVRGVVPGAPGLYFVGLRYQHTVASHDIYGVGADAEHVAASIGVSTRLTASEPEPGGTR